VLLYLLWLSDIASPVRFRAFVVFTASAPTATAGFASGATSLEGPGNPVFVNRDRLDDRGPAASPTGVHQRPSVEPAFKVKRDPSFLHCTPAVVLRWSLRLVGSRALAALHNMWTAAIA